MKKLLFLLFLPSCVSMSYLSYDDEQYVPKGSNVIELTSKMEKDSLFNAIAIYLTREGFRITENKERGSIFTEGKELMESTIGRYTITLDKTSGGSIATIRPEWRVTEKVATNASIMATAMSGIHVNAQSGWEIASWSNGRPNIAYSYGIKLAKNFGAVKYLTKY